MITLEKGRRPGSPRARRKPAARTSRWRSPSSTMAGTWSRCTAWTAAPWIAPEVAIGKAWTAAAYRAPSAAQGEKMKELHAFSASISAATGRALHAADRRAADHGRRRRGRGRDGRQRRDGQQDEDVVRAALSA